MCVVVVRVEGEGEGGGGGGGGHRAGRSCVKKFSRHADVNKCDVAASYTSLVSARGANK